MAGYYNDYSSLKNHQQRLWKVSDGVSLAGLGGLHVMSVIVAFGAAVVVTLMVAVVAAFLPIPTILLASLAFLVTWLGAYWWLTRENVKDTPLGLFRNYVLRQGQPSTYSRAIGADWTPDHMHWQVVLWRPAWAEVRIGSMRQWNTYDPSPVSEDARHVLDPTGTGELIGWADITADGDDYNPRLQLNERDVNRSVS